MDVSELRFWRFRWDLLRLLRRVILPEASVVLGYLAEDLIAARLLASHSRVGFYVDVGCNDPIRLSNTLLLYVRGWRGVNIDANPDLVRRNQVLRPRDRSICALVGPPGEERELTVFSDDALSTADPTFAKAWGAKVSVLRKLKCRSRALTEILDELSPLPRIDFLNVDVEGMDLEVLASLDLSRFDVGLIAVEIHGLDASSPDNSTLVRFLAERGYRLVAYNGLTAFFDKRGAGRPPVLPL